MSFLKRLVDASTPRRNVGRAHDLGLDLLGAVKDVGEEEHHGFSGALVHLAQG